MKRSFYLLALPVMAIIVAPVFLANSFGPTNAYTGSPLNNSSTCTNCHTGTANSGNGVLALNGLPAEYVPGQTYTLEVVLTNDNSTKYGFQIVALDGSNAEIGTLSESSSDIQVQNFASRTHLGHSSPNASGSWTFDWTAPADDSQGMANFYVAVNATNGDNGTTGDRVYTLQEGVLPEVSSNVRELEVLGLAMFPNPTKSFITITHRENGPLGVKIYSINGKLVLNEFVANGDQIDLSEFTKGMYIVKFEHTQGAVASRLIVQ